MLNNSGITREKVFDISVGIDYVKKEIYSAEKVTNMNQLKGKNSVAYDFILKLEEGAK
ncbi:hypothetical protein ACTGJ2_05800 [Streptococcus suis]|uniref:Uncharacterized protein n=1 Tax=Streptococcus suis TaxID=1307 RepID=A0A123T761_STRSU|nr:MULTISPECIES: hypothetical protein [Streptococcus]MBM7267960.1 hypothetical protein [Streptococcus suis]MBY0753141.1 hypothetical protein [Streptococcus sp. 2018037]MBY4634865.1 hypothetical protein [Streptococcus suis]MCK3923655.1 hypothetical protein [Streptococcus suis]MCL4880594.1 hypothetical protein [Streptococcus suis]